MDHHLTHKRKKQSRVEHGTEWAGLGGEEKETRDEIRTRKGNLIEGIHGMEGKCMGDIIWSRNLKGNLIEGIFRDIFLKKFFANN
jgi:hypothetical protein